MNSAISAKPIPREGEKHIVHEPGLPILSVNHLTVKYGEVLALDDIHFELNPSVRLAVVGPNGAGKSTLFKAIAGLLKPTSGSIEIAGHDPYGHLCISYI